MRKATQPVEPDCDIGLVVLTEPAKRPWAGSITQDEYDIDAPWHHHDMHQLQYAFEGSMELEDDRARHLLPRSLAGWIPAGTRHRNGLRRIRSISVLLRPDRLPCGDTGIRILSVSPLMRAMLTEAQRWPLDRPLDATGDAFFSAFASLCSEWIAEQVPFTLPTTRNASLAVALAQARADPAGSEMHKAASAAGMSERTLRRHCQAEIGMGWDEYRRRARLLAAVDALTATDRSVAQIAADVGFENQSAFARAFRTLTGEAPQAFRNRSHR